MALSQNNRYIKISNLSIDYINNRATVSLRTYSSKETRDKEKEVVKSISEFLFKAYQSVTSLESRLTAEQLAAGLSSSNAAEVFSSNPKLKSSIDRFASLYQEYGIIQSCLGRRPLHISTLKFDSFWESLGLTKELCEYSMTFIDTTISIPIPETTELSAIYAAIKSHMPKSEDC